MVVILNRVLRCESFIKVNKEETRNGKHLNYTTVRYGSKFYNVLTTYLLDLRLLRYVSTT